MTRPTSGAQIIMIGPFIAHNNLNSRWKKSSPPISLINSSSKLSLFPALWPTYCLRSTVSRISEIQLAVVDTSSDREFSGLTSSSSVPTCCWYSSHHMISISSSWWWYQPSQRWLSPRDPGIPARNISGGREVWGISWQFQNGWNLGSNLTHILNLPMGGTGSNKNRNTITDAVSKDTLPPIEEVTPSIYSTSAQGGFYVPRSSTQPFPHCCRINALTSTVDLRNSRWIHNPSR